MGGNENNNTYRTLRDLFRADDTNLYYRPSDCLSAFWPYGSVTKPNPNPSEKAMSLARLLSIGTATNEDAGADHRPRATAISHAIAM